MSISAVVKGGVSGTLSLPMSDAEIFSESEALAHVFGLDSAACVSCLTRRLRFEAILTCDNSKRKRKRRDLEGGVAGRSDLQSSVVVAVNSLVHCFVA